MTSSHATLRLAAGTRIVPARARKSGVRASTARLPSTRKKTSSPSLMPSASRTSLWHRHLPLRRHPRCSVHRISLLCSTGKDSVRLNLQGVPAEGRSRGLRRYVRVGGESAASAIGHDEFGPSSPERRPCALRGTCCRPTPKRHRVERGHGPARGAIRQRPYGASRHPHLLRWSRCRVVIWAIRSYGIGLASGNRAVLAPERYGDSCDS